MLNRQRFIALVLLALAGTSARAQSEDDVCWSPWRFRDYVGRALGPFGSKSTLQAQCFSTSAEAAAAVRAESTPLINQTISYPDQTSSIVVTWGGCGAGADEKYEPYGNPTVSCTYEVKETITGPLYSTPLVFKTSSRFIVALACGDFNGKAWVASVRGCKDVVTKLPSHKPPVCRGKPAHRCRQRTPPLRRPNEA